MGSILDDEQMRLLEATALEFVRQHGSITNRQIREACGISYDQAIAFFNAMVKDRKLKRTGTTSATKYKLP